MWDHQPVLLDIKYAQHKEVQAHHIVVISNYPPFDQPALVNRVWPIKVISPLVIPAVRALITVQKRAAQEWSISANGTTLEQRDMDDSKVYRREPQDLDVEEDGDDNEG